MQLAQRVVSSLLRETAAIADRVRHYAASVVKPCQIFPSIVWLNIYRASPVLPSVNQPGGQVGHSVVGFLRRLFGRVKLAVRARLK